MMNKKRNVNEMKKQTRGLIVLESAVRLYPLKAIQIPFQGIGAVSRFKKDRDRIIRVAAANCHDEIQVGDFDGGQTIADGLDILL
jgi:hypothetical protein